MGVIDVTQKLQLASSIIPWHEVSPSYLGVEKLTVYLITKV
jgi:hypothetical protein